MRIMNSLGEAGRELAVLLCDIQVSFPSYGLLSLGCYCHLHLNFVETVLVPVASWGPYISGRSVCLTLCQCHNAFINIVFIIFCMSHKI